MGEWKEIKNKNEKKTEIKKIIKTGNEHLPVSGGNIYPHVHRSRRNLATNTNLL